MDREILFRGKRTGNGEWVYGSLHTEYGEATKDGNRNIDYRILGMRGECSYVDPETVGQFTGLTDKNGTKIFEGDIVKDRWTKGIVTFGKHRIDCCGCCYLYHNTIGFYVDEGDAEIFSDEDAWDNLEVIGNIHDNPELMEVQE